MIRPVLAALVVAALATTTTGCGGDDAGSGSTAADRPVSEVTSLDDVPDEIWDDAMMQALEAIGATDVEMDGDTLRVHFDGSVEEAGAGVYCSAVEMAGEDATRHVLVYEDGELDCTKRYDG